MTADTPDPRPDWSTMTDEERMARAHPDRPVSPPSELTALREAVLAIPAPKRYENDANGNWFTTDMEYGWDCAIEAAAELIEDADAARAAPQADAGTLRELHVIGDATRLRAALAELCSCPPDWLTQDGSHARECIQTDIRGAIERAALAASSPATAGLRDRLAAVVQEMYIDGTLEPETTTLLSEIVDRLMKAAETP